MRPDNIGIIVIHTHNVVIMLLPLLEVKGNGPGRSVLTRPFSPLVADKGSIMPKATWCPSAILSCTQGGSKIGTEPSSSSFCTLLFNTFFCYWPYCWSCVWSSCFRMTRCCFFRLWYMFPCLYWTIFLLIDLAMKNNLLLQSRDTIFLLLLQGNRHKNVGI